MEPTKDKAIFLTPEQSERVKLWSGMNCKFSKIGVENGIRELVVGLNIIGYNTFVSCEGHGQGRLYEKQNGSLYQEWEHPYVAFSFEPQYIQKRPDSIVLQQLIDEFYTDRDVNPKYKIILTDFAKYMTQLSAGGVNTVDVPRGKNCFYEGEVLAIYWIRAQKKEMCEFGSFLKRKYLEIGFHI